MASPEGTQAEYEVRSLLDKLPGVATAFLIDERHDRGHWDIEVVLEQRRTTFFAQVKKLSNNQLRIDARHLDDWFQSHTLTVLMWWDEPSRKCYWADPLRFLFRTGGLGSRKTLLFSERDDLVLLDPDEPSSRKHFLGWALYFAANWPEIQRLPKLLVDEEYPLTLPMAARDPDLLSFLPASSELLRLIRRVTHLNERDLPSNIAAVFRAGAEALQSPESASARLLSSVSTSPPDAAVVHAAVEHLRRWADTVRSDQRVGVRDALFGFDTAVSLLAGPRDADWAPPAFRARNTYPFGRILNLFPVDDALESLARVLIEQSDATALQYAAYALGIINYPRQSIQTVLDIARDARTRLSGRRELIGSGWRVADRQLLYTQAQLGSGEATQEFLRALEEADTLAFEAAYNWVYYSGDREVIRRRFEDRLEAGTRNDQHVRDILVRIYDGIRKHREK